MWARLHADRIEIIHTPRNIDTDLIHHSKAIFTDWTAEELYEHLRIVPAAYVDTPPGDGFVMASESAELSGDRVAVTRSWVPAPVQPVTQPAPADGGLDMEAIMKRLERLHEAQAYRPGDEASKHPLLSKWAVEQGLTLAEAADRQIEALARLKRS